MTPLSVVLASGRARIVEMECRPGKRKRDLIWEHEALYDKTVYWLEDFIVRGDGGGDIAVMIEAGFGDTTDPRRLGIFRQIVRAIESGHEWECTFALKALANWLRMCLHKRQLARFGEHLIRLANEE